MWLALLAGALIAAGAPVAQAEVWTCAGALPEKDVNRDGSPQPDLQVTGTCNAQPGFKYFYRNVSVLDGGVLLFQDHVAEGKYEFWASSIIIERNGILRASGVERGKPFGSSGARLTIYLYGENEAVWDDATQKFTTQNQGALCQSPQPEGAPPCGIPAAVWNTDRKNPVDLPGDVLDFFYQYGPLYGDGRCYDPSNPNNKSWVFDNKQGACVDTAGTVKKTGKAGYFGNKVLAVSYGGTLDLKGYKGAAYEQRPSWDSGRSWTRLWDGHPLNPGDKQVALDISVKDNWAVGDEFVVTTTDYLPSHSEKFTINNFVTPNIIGLGNQTVQWPHNGVRYGGRADDTKKQWKTRLVDRIKASFDPDVVTRGAETRAAVALLSRSITIASAGTKAGEFFPAENTGYHYGAHMVARQGFKKVQIQGVAFKQMGQGGRLGHYPVHFHMARKTPQIEETFVKDSSINESMTRWIVLHSTLGVTLARNVGYKSIGHGFYLEDGTETDNRFYSNIGIYARASVGDYEWRVTPRDMLQNPRLVPGILSDNGTVQAFPYRSDAVHPTVFWISNGWNDFVGNMAAGAGACGAAYWLVPALNTDHVEVTKDEHEHMNWSGYSSIQKVYGGTAPLKNFFRNYATSTMLSLQTTSDAPDCLGIIAFEGHPVDNEALALRAVKSEAPRSATADSYYPQVFYPRRPTRCDKAPTGDCSSLLPCAKDQLGNCMATVIDYYTSSFHWAEGNISALWLRPQWYVLSNSFISDVQNGGLTFVSGGDYTQVIQGYWAVVRNTVFVGNTIDNAKNMYTRNVGPFNATYGTALWCDRKWVDGKKKSRNYCLSAAEAISMPVSDFMTNQRLSNIYDGPSYQDSNAYLDITPAECPPWQDDVQNNCMYGSQRANLRLRLTERNRDGVVTKVTCSLPNAAIGWKQPNGFYYPPAFHSRNLFFDNVPLRHYVINPLFKVPEGVRNIGQGGTYLTDTDAVKEQYCLAEGQSADIFMPWTSIDRQTELNDDDGTLTGLGNSAAEPALKQTISVNDDSFFNAPAEAKECASAFGGNADPGKACAKPNADLPAVTAKTSPYDYVSTVVYPEQKDKSDTSVWGSECTAPFCYGVPLYRQYLTGDRTKGTGEWQQWFGDKCNTLKPGDKPSDIQRAQCRWPFIRMAGANMFQRQTMTVNNGSYYLDTTVSASTQRDEHYTNDPRARSYNVFTNGQTYYVFFLYAKRSTAQTYKIYVGPNFALDRFSPVRVDISKGDLDFGKVAKDTWVKPDVKDGFLTVTTNFKDRTDLDPTPSNGLCQPAAFCKASGNSCTGALPDNHPLKKDSDYICKAWAIKDLDCPPYIKNGDGTWKQGGCYGFSFKLANPVADDSYQRPQPDPFPAAKPDQGRPDWGATFTTDKILAPDNKSGGQCYYDAKLPPVSGPCKSSP
jgi:hypothetical protein